MAEVAPTAREIDSGQGIWERLRDQDPVAPLDLAEAFLDSLVNWLIAGNPRIEPEICASAANDAIVALIKDPSTYKPERQKLEVYLHISASGDLKNLLRSEDRHRERRADWESVELSPAVGKNLEDGSEDPAVVVENAEATTESRGAARALIDRVRHELAEGDVRVLDLLLTEERATAVFARALGLDGLPLVDQERLVKRAKDRVKKRIERARDGHE